MTRMRVEKWNDSRFEDLDMAWIPKIGAGLISRGRGGRKQRRLFAPTKFHYQSFVEFANGRPRDDRKSRRVVSNVDIGYGTFVVRNCAPVGSWIAAGPVYALQNTITARVNV